MTGLYAAAAIFWVFWTVAFLVFELVAVFNRRQGDTLSETTRAFFHIKTSRLGRAIFILTWFGFAAWFGIHILTGLV